MSHQHAIIPFWAVVQTEVHHESAAALNLRKTGFETYLPQFKMKWRGDWKNYPLFPNYLFVRIKDHWHAIARGRGVVRILMAGETPARLSDEVVIQIRSREGQDGFIRLARRNPLVGTKVRVLTGQFGGHIGIYDGMTAQDRERVLLELLGRSVPVELARTDRVEIVQTLAKA